MGTIATGTMASVGAAVVVMGGANVDVKARSTHPATTGTSNPGHTTRSAGGVGRNIAENLARLGTPVHLVAAVGDDADGALLLTRTAAAGVDVSLVRRGPDPTGTYTAVLDATGELVIAVADMAATDGVSEADVDAAAGLIAGAALLVLDGNLAEATVARALDLAQRSGCRVLVEPVSVTKAARLAGVLHPARPVFAVTPNRDELAALSGHDLTTEDATSDEGIAAAAAALHGRGVELVWVRLGAHGSALFPPARPPWRFAARRASVVDVTGAGDAMLAAFAHALLTGRSPADAVRYGHAVAPLTVAVGGDGAAGPHRQPARGLRDPAPRESEMTQPHPGLSVAPEVREALAAMSPVVALESTIISHGMPYPDNVAMATEVEAIIRAQGAVPATIAVLHGRARVGLAPADLELLASSPDVSKVSRRDLPHVMTRGAHGATTVAATMRLAALAGIRVFVTGGLGGVHRGAAASFDVSADLTELAQTDVAVVCAGVKSILDIGLTLETLETLGVPVVCYGTDEFPAFFTRHSGFGAPLRSDTAEEIAATMRVKWQLGIEGGLVVAQPIGEAEEIPAAEISSIIDRALGDLAGLRISGKDATPYLLGRIVEITGGRSLRANVALVKHNAVLGARIAAAYAA